MRWQSNFTKKKGIIFLREGWSESTSECKLCDWWGYNFSGISKRWGNISAVLWVYKCQAVFHLLNNGILSFVCRGCFPEVNCQTLCATEMPIQISWSRRLWRPCPMPLSSTWILALSIPMVASPTRTCTTTSTWLPRATRLCVNPCTLISSPCSINLQKTEQPGHKRMPPQWSSALFPESVALNFLRPWMMDRVNYEGLKAAQKLKALSMARVGDHCYR